MSSELRLSANGPKRRVRAFPELWGAGNRYEVNNSFALNKNPEIEHTKVIDFAPKTTVFASQNTASRHPSTLQKPAGRHRNVFSGRLLTDPLESSVGGLCVFAGRLHQ